MTAHHISNALTCRVPASHRKEVERAKQGVYAHICPSQSPHRNHWVHHWPFSMDNMETRVILHLSQWGTSVLNVWVHLWWKNLIWFVTIFLLWPSVLLLMKPFYTPSQLWRCGNVAKSQKISQTGQKKHMIRQVQNKLTGYQTYPEEKTKKWWENYEIIIPNVFLQTDSLKLELQYLFLCNEEFKLW